MSLLGEGAAATGTAGGTEVMPTSAKGPLSKPEGIPDDWIEKPSKKNDGIRYTDPNNSGNEVRVMPGSPSSAYPDSQMPYVRWQLNGQPLDVNGNPVAAKTPDAHIPLTDFKFNPKIFQ